MPALDYIECYHHHHQLIKVITTIIKMSCVLILIQCRTQFGDNGEPVYIGLLSDHILLVRGVHL